MPLEERVILEFESRFKGLPSLVARAPGRVNLIGEHTDYNEGFVLPMAIDRAAWIALRPRPGQEIEVHALEFQEIRRFSLEAVEDPGTGRGPDSWIEYLKGVAWALQEAGHQLQAWEGVVAGDVPIGAGLSSSAALELATARAFAGLGDWPWEPAAMARLAQRAENQWVGVNCGIMDQMISAAGRADHALLLDCRSLEYELVPLPAHAAVVVLDTGTRRGLVGSAYNERRAQCEAAAAFFGVRALRDLEVEQFEARAPGLDELVRRRARHVVTEDDRTRQAAAAMRQGDARTLGALMDASHESLRRDFEVSSPALDAMVECARQSPGCLGARMTGAGFGGCAVALVEVADADRFTQFVGPEYQRATGNTPAIYVCRATDGAGLV